MALYYLNLNKSRSQILNPKVTNYQIQYMSFSETEILFVEKVEDSLISIDRKSYHFKLMRYENSNNIQEASISVDLTSLLDAPGLKLDYIQN